MNSDPHGPHPAPGHVAPDPAKGLGYVGIVTTVVVLLCFALGPSAFLLGSRYFEDQEPAPRGRATTVPSLDRDPFVSPSPETPPAKLRDLTPVSVVGPTWQPGEKTYTFAFRNVPFAFRGGATWGCMSGDWETDDGTPIEGLGWRCIDEKAGKNRPQVDILIRPCGNGCGPEQQAELDSDWLDEPVSYVRRDPTTRYAESTKNGKYTLVVSHFFGDKPGGKPRYQVGLMLECRPIDKAVAHKVVNDIRTQSG
ncbi:MAG: hypothetical protein ACRDTU_23110 [Micromonosporaceae bacterium]